LLAHLLAICLWWLVEVAALMVEAVLVVTAQALLKPLLLEPLTP
jgi:hypothetical protein